MARSRRNRHAVRKVTAGQFAQVTSAFLLVSVLIGVLVAGMFVPLVGAAGATVKAVPAAFDELPADLELVVPSEESRMLDANGREFARFFSARRIVVPADKIAPIMNSAIIAIEDKRFYDHHGVDPEGMMRALINNLGGNSTQGGSTITQQYVKNMLLEEGIQAADQDLIDEAQEHSAKRKLREARYAVALEAKMTKEEILTGYLNVAPFGPTIYGVEAASRTYFSKGAIDLTAGEAALLAGLVQSPVQYDPLRYPEAAQARRDIVLAEMLEQEDITRAEYNEAREISVEDMLNPDVRTQGCSGAPDNLGYFCSYVLEDFLADETFGENRAERLSLLQTGGLVLRTTVDRTMQKQAYSAVTATVPVYDDSGLNTAIVSVVPQTGHIVAMAQNTDYGVTTESAPRSTQVSFNVYSDHGGGSGFQPGSTFKIFTLAQWFVENKSAHEMVGDPNRVYRSGVFECGGRSYWTDNFPVGDLSGKDGKFTVIDTMKRSINQAIVNMATQVDYCQIFELANRVGVVTEDGSAIGPENPSGLIGGSGSVSPLVMATSYATFANNGIKCEPMALLEVADRDGQVLRTYEPKCSQAIDQKIAQQVSTVMRMTADSYYYRMDRPAAAKSGTTDNNANAWMVGYVPQLATAAWAGFANNSSRPVQDIVINGKYWDYIYGGTFIGPMWVDYMNEAVADLPVQDIPNVFIGDIPRPEPTEKPDGEGDNEGDNQGDNQGNGQGDNQGGDNNDSHDNNG